MNLLIASQALQITVVACVVWLVTKTVTYNRSHLSHVLWLVVLLKCITPPIWSSSAGVFCWVQEAWSSCQRIDEPEETAAVSTDALSEQLNSSTLHFIQAQNQVAVKPNPYSSKSLAGDTPNVSRPFESIVPSATQPFELVRRATPKRKVIAPATRSIAVWILACWSSIAILLLLGTLIKMVRLIRQLEKSEVEHTALQELANASREKLGIANNVRLLVTSQAVGPAVIGFFRPLIVIPKYLVDRFSAAELEPILAHELLHIRRGDLWFGLLRHFARCLWWFHPLVWKMSTEVRRSAERCCDEEVVTSLGISPQQYARTLLSVLEMKQFLRAIPVAPGVRPFDITSDRLEKIMKLGHGSHRRTPVWCWAIAVLVALILLPGANRIHGEEGNVFAITPPKNPIRVADATKPHIPPISPAPALRSSADPIHATIDSPSVILKCRFMEGSVAAIDELHVPWHVMPSSPDRTDDTTFLQGKLKPVWGESSVSIEKKQPIFYALLDDEKVASIFGKRKDKASVSTLSRPHLMTNDGDVGSIQVGSQRPFVVGVNHKGPVIHTYDCGLNASLRPIMLDNGVQLKYRLASKEILSVEEVELNTGEHSGIAVQVPEVKSSVLVGENVIPDGKSLLLRMETGKITNGKGVLLVLVRPTRIVPIKAKTKTGKSVSLEYIPWNSLKRSPPKEVTIQSGDVLGVYLTGIHGAVEHVPPIEPSDTSEVPPTLASPMPVQDDGTIALPYIDDPVVVGLTLDEAQEKLIDAYAANEEVLKEDQTIVLSMMRPKHLRVFVARYDTFGEAPYFVDSGRVLRANAVKSTRPSSGFELQIPAHDADVLTALANTGGLPGPDAKEVVVLKGSDQAKLEIKRIALQIPKGQAADISEADIALEDGDVVIVAPDKTDAELTDIAHQLLFENRNGKRREDSTSFEKKEEVATSLEPSLSSLDSRGWRLTLDECVRIALQNSSVTRSLGLRASKSISSSRIHLVRLRTDIAVSDAEINARDFLFEVTQAYWNLWFQYHNLDAARSGFANAHAAWKHSNSPSLSLTFNPDFAPTAYDVAVQETCNASVEGALASFGTHLSFGDAANEAESRARYFAFKGRVEQATTDLLRQESRLRCLLGLSARDGRLIQPADQPSKAMLEFDRGEIKSEALRMSPELRRQLWRVKQNKKRVDTAMEQLQRTLDRKYLQHFIDQVATNAETDPDGRKLGLKFSVPVGHRAELTQLRRQQLQLLRSKKRLEDLRVAITQELSSARTRARDSYQTFQTNYTGLKAYRDQLQVAQVACENGRVGVNVVLDATLRLAQAEIDYFRSLLDYQGSIDEVHRRKGSLLEVLSVDFAETEARTSTAAK